VACALGTDSTTLLLDGVDNLTGMAIAEGLSHIAYRLEDLQSRFTELLVGKNKKEMRSYGSIIIEVDDEKRKENSIHEHTFVDEKEAEMARKLSGLGLIAALAIGVHNFPEGMATFVATLSNSSFGLVVTMAIAIHNIPEGLCVALPFYYATGSKLQGFIYSLLAGISMPIGAIIAWGVVGGMGSPLVYAILFGIIAGIMVFISIRELLPTG